MTDPILELESCGHAQEDWCGLAQLHVVAVVHACPPPRTTARWYDPRVRYVVNDSKWNSAEEFVALNSADVWKPENVVLAFSAKLHETAKNELGVYVPGCSLAQVLDCVQ